MSGGGGGGGRRPAPISTHMCGLNLEGLFSSQNGVRGVLVWVCGWVIAGLPGRGSLKCRTGCLLFCWGIAPISTHMCG